MLDELLEHGDQIWHGGSSRDPFVYTQSNPTKRSLALETRTGLRTHFGPFFVSLGSLLPKQSNRGQFGTDIEIQITQWVEGVRKAVRVRKAPARAEYAGLEQFGSEQQACSKLGGRHVVTAGSRCGRSISRVLLVA
jgi:hypothetical protein